MKYQMNVDGYMIMKSCVSSVLFGLFKWFILCLYLIGSFLVCFLSPGRNIYLRTEQTRSHPIHTTIHSIPKLYRTLRWASIPSLIHLFSGQFIHPSIHPPSPFIHPGLLFSHCVSRRLRRTGVVGVTIFSGFSAGRRTVKAFTAFSTTMTRSSAAYETTPLKYLSVFLSVCLLLSSLHGVRPNLYTYALFCAI